MKLEPTWTRGTFLSLALIFSGALAGCDDGAAPAGDTTDSETPDGTDGENDVGRAVFCLAKRRGWELGELRPEIRTLESVFREVIAAEAAVNSAGREVAP